MNRLIKETEQFAEWLAEQYFVKRELSSLSSFLKDQVSWIGTGADEISNNLTEARRALERELLEYSGSFTIMERDFHATPLSDTLCVLYGTLCAVPEDPGLSEENLRLSLVAEKTPEGMKLVHLHLSRADRDQEKGRYYVPKTARADALTLQMELNTRSRQIENLTRYIPCGVHQCKNDPNFTLVSMSDGFYTMFGYTREDIKNLFDDKFINMIYPGDRAELLKVIHDQLQRGRDIELEYRILCKNGTPVWVLDKGRLLEDGNGGECFYCVLMEITDRKLEQEELRLSLERHQVIVDQATDIIFEWDIRKDTLSFSPNWRKKFGYDPISQKISGRIPLSHNIHPEDIPAFMKIMQDTAAGVPYSETEFRIKDIGGEYTWCRIRATAQYDADARPIKAVGVILDIDGEKKQKQVLLDQAQRDALTGLYNKAVIARLVEQRLRECGPSGKQALLIIDVDHFKAVNDTYGHLAGDSLLSDVAAVLRGHLRSTDIVGRIGGDEFLAYLPQVADEAAAQSKAAELLAAMSLLTPEKGAPPITCSIGVAVCAHGEKDYYTLCKQADQALYCRKNCGRGGVSVYDPAVCNEPISNLRQAAAEEEDEGDVLDNRLPQYAFRMLYAAQDTEAALNRLLEIIGRSYDVSRAYIFESSEDGLYCSNTYEWCNEGVEPQIETLQNISYREIGDYPKNFNQKGIFYCHDIESVNPCLYQVLAPQRICSMLQCAMLDEGEFKGYVGFDECRSNREWSARQIAAFKLTADVLSSFLIKLRQKQKLRKAIQEDPRGRNEA